MGTAVAELTRVAGNLYRPYTYFGSQFSELQDADSKASFLERIDSWYNENKLHDPKATEVQTLNPHRSREIRDLRRNKHPLRYNR